MVFPLEYSYLKVVNPDTHFIDVFYFLTSTISTLGTSIFSPSNFEGKLVILILVFTFLTTAYVLFNLLRNSADQKIRILFNPVQKKFQRNISNLEMIHRMISYNQIETDKAQKFFKKIFSKAHNFEERIEDLKNKV